MHVLLVMFKADGTRRDFPLRKDRTVVGRNSTADLRIPLSSVSRQHCELVLGDDTVTIRDLGSSNGTFQNGARVQEAELQPGDEIVIGPVVFTVVIDGKPARIEPVPTLLNKNQPSGDTAAEAAPIEDEEVPIDALEEIVPEGEEAEEDEAIISAEALAEDEDDEDAPVLLDEADEDEGADSDQDPIILEEAKPSPPPSAKRPPPRPPSKPAPPEGDEPVMLEEDQAGGEEPVLTADESSPTVDLDDPIAALEAMARSEETPRPTRARPQPQPKPHAEDDDIPLILDEDDGPPKGKKK